MPEDYRWENCGRTRVHTLSMVGVYRFSRRDDILLRPVSRPRYQQKDFTFEGKRLYYCSIKA